MNNVFVYIEIEGTEVREVSQELLTKGRKLANELGVELHAVAIGTGINAFQSSLVEEQAPHHGHEVSILHGLIRQVVALLPQLQVHILKQVFGILSVPRQMVSHSVE